MAKRKGSPALFEVISKGNDGGLVLPEWMNKPAPASGETSEPSQAKPASPEPPQYGPAPPPPLPQARHPQSVAPFAADQHRPAGGGMFRIVAIASGAVLLLLVAFFIGRALMPDGEVTPQDDGQQVAGGGPTGGSGPAAGGGDAAEFRFAPDKHYLIVQGDIGLTDRANAERIVSFLAEKGVEATIHRYRSSSRTNEQKYMVVSHRGFDSATSLEAKEYARISAKVWGPEYFRKYRSQGPTHDFRQNPDDPWYVAGDLLNESLNR
jgi:hypothetical protein